MKKKPKLDPYLGATSLSTVMELYENLTKPIFTTKDLEVPPRTVANWDKIGLIGLKREDEDDWRRLSFMDYFWVHFIDELRKAGLPVPVISKAREAILAPISDLWGAEVMGLHPDQHELLTDGDKVALGGLKPDGETSVSLFMALVVDSIIHRRIVSFVIFLDGTALPWFRDSNEHWSDDMLYRKDHEIHVTIPTSGLFKKFLNNPRTAFTIRKLDLLNEGEKHVLELIQSGKYTSITINFRDKKMKSLELVKEQDVKRRIVDVLADASYQNIVIKTHKGMVTRIENTVKVYL